MDYKPLYYTLFHAITEADSLLDAWQSPHNVQKAREILKKAQADTEAMFQNSASCSTITVLKKLQK